LVVSACRSATDGGPADAGTVETGVQGVTDVDVGCPATRDAGACPRRPLAARLRFVRRDRDVRDPERRTVEVRTGEDGAFTVELPPGRYDVVPDNLVGAPYPRAEPVTVEVHEGTLTVITVSFDSGVR
jgi:hypothetical protein